MNGLDPIRRRNDRAMKALVYTAPGEVTYRDEPAPLTA
jgi:hypothetical protein